MKQSIDELSPFSKAVLKAASKGKKAVLVDEVHKAVSHMTRNQCRVRQVLWELVDAGHLRFDGHGWISYRSAKKAA